MKKIKLSLIALCAVFVVSCNDAIDITQPSELTPERAFETLEDLELGINGVYSRTPGENAIYFTSVFTDEVAIGRNNGGQGTDGELAFQLFSTSGDAASIWVSNYGLINAANRLIVGAENVSVEAGSAEETQKNDILAQAYALRAYGHFTLLSYFAEDIKDDSSLGVILQDYVPLSNDQSLRSTTGEVFNLIEGDLDFAEANLTSVPVTTRTYISQNFIRAFRARMAAYRGDYNTANQYVTELQASYVLTPKAQYPAIFLDTETPQSEVIFKFERTRGTNGNFYQFWSSVNSTINGSPFFEVNRALFNLVNNPNDVRRFVIADATSLVMPNYNDPSVSDAQYLQNDVLPVGKYSVTESQNLLGDIKVFRMSEMILIKAEYFAQNNDFLNVANQIAAIRSARYGSAQTVATPATSQAAWGLIMDERRAELAFEGHRYIDIRRLGPLAGRGVERDPRDCSFNGFCTLPATDHRFILPIPLSEIAANPQIAGQQNPNY